MQIGDLDFSTVGTSETIVHIPTCWPVVDTLSYPGSYNYTVYPEHKTTAQKLDEIERLIAEVEEEVKSASDCGKRLRKLKRKLGGDTI